MFGSDGLRRPRQQPARFGGQRFVGRETDARPDGAQREAAAHVADVLLGQPATGRPHEGATGRDDRTQPAGHTRLVPEQTVQGQETRHSPQTANTTRQSTYIHYSHAYYYFYAMRLYDARVCVCVFDEYRRIPLGLLFRAIMFRSGVRIGTVILTTLFYNVTGKCPKPSVNQTNKTIIVRLYFTSPFGRMKGPPSGFFSFPGGPTAFGTQATVTLIVNYPYTYDRVLFTFLDRLRICYLRENCRTRLKSCVRVLSGEKMEIYSLCHFLGPMRDTIYRPGGALIMRRTHYTHSIHVVLIYIIIIITYKLSILLFGRIKLGRNR